MTRLQVGDTLYIPNGGQGFCVTVTKVGRKWATAGHGEYAIEPEENGSHERKPHPLGIGDREYVWRSEGDYIEGMKRAKRRNALMVAISDGVSWRGGDKTLEQLEAAAKALGIEVTP